MKLSLNNSIKIGVFNDLDLLQFAGNSTNLLNNSEHECKQVVLNEASCSLTFLDTVSPAFHVTLVRFSQYQKLLQQFPQLSEKKIVVGIPGVPTHNDISKYPNCVNLSKKPELYSKIFELTEMTTISKCTIGVFGHREFQEVQQVCQRFGGTEFTIPFFGGKIVCFEQCNMAKEQTVNFLELQLVLLPIGYSKQKVLEERYKNIKFVQISLDNLDSNLEMFLAELLKHTKDAKETLMKFVK